MGRLTVSGVDGIRAFCSGCPDVPLFGKCDIGNECYFRQVFKKAQAYEDTGLTPSDIADMHNELCLKCGLYKTAHEGSCDGCRWKKGE